MKGFKISIAPHKLPSNIITNLDRFRQALTDQDVVAFDFETTGLSTKYNRPVGLGAYVGATGEAFYLNVRHNRSDANIPRYASEELADALRFFFNSSDRVSVWHNATFDIRWIQKLGIDIRCKVLCTLMELCFVKHIVDGQRHHFTYKFSGCNVLESTKVVLHLFLPLKQNALPEAVFWVKRSGINFEWVYFLEANDDECKFEFYTLLTDWKDDPNWKLWVIMMENQLDGIIEDAMGRIFDGIT